MEKPKISYNSELGEYVNNEKLAVLHQYHTWKCYVPSDAEDIFVPVKVVLWILCEHISQSGWNFSVIV